MMLLTKDAFLQENGGAKFDKVVFRPGASFTTPFGLDNTFGALRIHAAIDRGRDGLGGYPIYVPFETVHAEFLSPYEGFGSLLILHTLCGFEVRIAHIEELAPVFRSAMARGDVIAPKTYIAEAGAAGKSVGRHTHVEIVSDGITNPVLDEILADKVGKKALDHTYTHADIQAFCDKVGITGDTYSMFRSEWERRKLFRVNDYICDRVDYHTNRPRRFYSSQALFGM